MEKETKDSFNCRISVIGNCQAEAIAWYLRRLPQISSASKDGKAVCNFLVAERFSDHMKQLYKEGYKGKLFLHANRKNRHRLVENNERDVKYNIHEAGKIKKMIQLSDVIVFQKIKPQTSNILNFGRVKGLAKDSAQLISIPSFHYHDKAKRFKREMDKHDKELGVRVTGDFILKRNNEIKSLDQTNHPNYLYFLEVVKIICEINGWEFFSEDQISYFNKIKFPFG